MEKEKLHTITRDIENLAGEISNLTSLLSLLAEANMDKCGDRDIESVLFLSADCSKRLKNESYRIWKVLRGENS